MPVILYKMKHNLFTSDIRVQAPIGVAKRDILLLSYTRYDNRSRVIAHGLKRSLPDAITTAAFQMSPCLPENCVMVPMPSHTGAATYTLQLANLMSEISGAKVLDCLKGTPRLTNYAAKRSGHSLRLTDFGFYLSDDLPEDKVVCLIDNCIDRGATAFAAANVIGRCVVLSYAMTGVLIV